MASLLGASFLVFLFGVYAGRELEARKTTENMQVVRVSNKSGGEKIPEAHSKIVETNAETEEKKKFPSPSSLIPEIPKTVVVVSPQKPSETAVPPLSSAIAVKEMPPETNLVKKTPTELVAKERNSESVVPPVNQEKKPVSKTIFSPPSSSSSLLKSPQPVKGRWSVQIHATRDEKAAQQLVRKLRDQGYVPLVSKIVRDGEVWYRVRVGSFANSEEARASVERFRREGKFSQAYPVSN